MNRQLKKIEQKVYKGQRINFDEGVFLFENAELGFTGKLANFIRSKKHGNKTYFIRNIHLEPTNICINQCKFCSYFRQKSDKDSWFYSINEIEKILKQYQNKNLSEIHIVGGINPGINLEYYSKILKIVKDIFPGIHIKAFTAVEIEYVLRKAGYKIEQGLKYLKSMGLDSIPGGGAEIFNSSIRKKICENKISTEMWLEIHYKAHQCNIPSNATMLYGHIERYAHRIEHMERLRQLQDKTHKFNAFIPLKYRKRNNLLSYAGEVSIIEDLKNYAVSRIYLDNFPHIKAYWPMLGREASMLALDFGVDDIDGTIYDTTKIYTMAGVEEQKSILSVDDIIRMIKESGKTAVERDGFYNIIRRNGSKQNPD